MQNQPAPFRDSELASQFGNLFFADRIKKIDQILKPQKKQGFRVSASLALIPHNLINSIARQNRAKEPVISPIVGYFRLFSPFFDPVGGRVAETPDFQPRRGVLWSKNRKNRACKA